MQPSFEFQGRPKAERCASPFNARGVVYCRMLDEARALPGGIVAFREGLADEGIGEFFAQAFRWTDWYDALPMATANLVMARMAGVQPEMMARLGGESSARELVPRMFRILLGVGGIGAAAQHIPWVLPWFFDFSDARVLAATNQSASVLLSNVPKVVAATYVNAILGFMAGTAELIDHAPATAEYADITMTGERDGFARMSMRCTVKRKGAEDSRRTEVSPFGGSLDDTSSLASAETAVHRIPRGTLTH